MGRSAGVNRVVAIGRRRVAATGGNGRIAAPERSARLQALVRQLLTLVGENPDREGLRRTPLRVQASLRFLTEGYRQDAERLLNGAVFPARNDEMVVIRDIDFYSLCEHHLLPFFGRCHVAYVPKGKIIGISKVPKLVEMFSRRLQVQENLTTEIAEALQERIQPCGVAVVMEAQHLCMMMRGVQKQNARMVTSSMLGCFRTDAKSRSEFLGLIRD